MKENSLTKAAEVIAFLKANSDETPTALKNKGKKSVVKPAKKSSKRRP
ncbi:MAG: hypothetical protein F2815_04365 [Actinobacteria bacterium]|nr:hypothetical protein [Actinomycetota bacterium]MSY82784.1 hypothetical protein [Actinomycetota bacterium]